MIGILLILLAIALPFSLFVLPALDWRCSRRSSRNRSMTSVPNRRNRRLHAPNPTRVKIAAGALERLVAEVREHARLYPRTEMGCLLLGRYVDGVPWITEIIDQGPEAIFTSGSVSFDAEYQAVHFRISGSLHPESRILGVAHLQPRSMTFPSRLDLRNDLEWLGNGAGRRSGIFIILTHDPEGESDLFEARGGVRSLRYRGVQLNAYWLSLDGEKNYRELWIDAGMGPDHGGECAPFRSLLRSRYRELSEALETLSRPEIHTMKTDGEPALALAFRMGELRGMNVLSVSGARWLCSSGDDRWLEFSPSHTEDLILGDLEMLMELRKEAAHGKHPAIRTPVKIEKSAESAPPV